MKNKSQKVKKIYHPKDLYGNEPINENTLPIAYGVTEELTIDEIKERFPELTESELNDMKKHITDTSDDPNTLQYQMANLRAQQQGIESPFEGQSNHQSVGGLNNDTTIDHVLKFAAESNKKSVEIAVKEERINLIERLNMLSISADTYYGVLQGIADLIKELSQ